MDQDVSIPAFQKYLLGVKAKTTARKYAAYAGSFLRSMRASGYQSFSDLPPGMLSEFASELSSQGKEPATVRVEVFAVKKYLSWVEAKGIRVTRQYKPELPQRTMKIRPSLPQDRFEDYFYQADLLLEEPVRTAVMLLPCSGLRASEMVSLKLESIQRATVPLAPDPKTKKKRVKDTLFLCVKGKGGKERNVPLMEEGVEILVGYLSGWRRGHKGPWLFPRVTRRTAKNGAKHISDTHLRNALREMRESLGLPHLLTPHTMRRTYITTLYHRGIDLGLIANIAGHANVQTTLDHYINIDAQEGVLKLHAAGSSLTD